MGIAPKHINLFKLSELGGLITQEALQIVQCENIGRRLPDYFIVARKV
jgi:hypothetical protein